MTSKTLSTMALAVALNACGGAVDDGEAAPDVKPPSEHEVTPESPATETKADGLQAASVYYVNGYIACGWTDAGIRTLLIPSWCYWGGYVRTVGACHQDSYSKYVSVACYNY